MKNNSSKKLISIILYGISFVILLAIYLQGVFLPVGSEFGFLTLNFYIIIPLTVFIISIILSMKRSYLFWLYPIFVGIAANLILYLKFYTFDLFGILFSFLPTIIGCIIGWVFTLIKN